jgi:hypothetical protein
MKLYRHELTFLWTVDDLISTIKLTKPSDLKVQDVNVDLHKRVAAARGTLLAKGHFTSHQYTVCNATSVIYQL